MTTLSPDPHHVAASTSADAWFGHHFGVALPRGLREQVGALSWERFVAVYGLDRRTRAPGALVLCRRRAARHPDGPAGAQLSCRDRRRRPHRHIHRGGRRSGRGAHDHAARARNSVRDTGLSPDVLGKSRGDLIRGTNGARTEWAMGWAKDSTESALRALIACANRLVA